MDLMCCFRATNHDELPVSLKYWLVEEAGAAPRLIKKEGKVLTAVLGASPQEISLASVD